MARISARADLFLLYHPLHVRSVVGQLQLRELLLQVGRHWAALLDLSLGPGNQRLRQETKNSKFKSKFYQKFKIQKQP